MLGRVGHLSSLWAHSSFCREGPLEGPSLFFRFRRKWISFSRDDYIYVLGPEDRRAMALLRAAEADDDRQVEMKRQGLILLLSFFLFFGSQVMVHVTLTGSKDHSLGQLDSFPISSQAG